MLPVAVPLPVDTRSTICDGIRPMGVTVATAFPPASSTRPLPRESVNGISIQCTRDICHRC